MRQTRHINHILRHIGFSYPVSLSQRMYSMILVPILTILAVVLLIKFLSFAPIVGQSPAYLSNMLEALLATFSRLLVAYGLAIVFAIPLALLIDHGVWAERILLPLFDIIQSIPVLAFFPVIILFFAHSNFLNGAAITIIFLNMLWNIVFSIVGGLKSVPKDIISASRVFHIRGFAYLRKVLLPAIFPYIVTGSLLAWAQGWNIIIVAEVLHTYIPGGTPTQDLFGIGSALVNASALGETRVFIASLFAMIFAIAIMNFFVWQKLLHYAERFKFE